MKGILKKKHDKEQEKEQLIGELAEREKKKKISAPVPAQAPQKTGLQLPVVLGIGGLVLGIAIVVGIVLYKRNQTEQP